MAEGLKSVSESLIKKCDDLADGFYRNPAQVSPTATEDIMKLLLGYTQLILKLDPSEKGQQFVVKCTGYFKNLADAYEAKDYVLEADILHFDFAGEIKSWIDQM